MTTDAAPTGESPRSHPRRHPGFFLALDGPDGSGKTSQMARVADWLRGRGFEVVTCRDPGGTALGDRLRLILLDRRTVPIGSRAEALLFMASRAQLVDEVIRPALDSGSVVVCDRFALSNLVYQGYAGGLGVEAVDRVGQLATNQLDPDLTLVLDIPPELARARTGGSRDRMEDRSESYRGRVREGFLRAARASEARAVPVRGIVIDQKEGVEGQPPSEWERLFGASARPPIRLIDASADPVRVFEHIQREVMLALALDPRT